MLRTIWPAAVAAAAVAVLGLSPVKAAAEYETRSVEVPYGDLDLSREAGAQTMLNRIRSAAGTVCGSEPFILDLAERGAYVTCQRESVGQAVVDVNAPMLTALYQRGGGRVGVVIYEELPSAPPPAGYQGGPPPAQPGNITMQPIPNP